MGYFSGAFALRSAGLPNVPVRQPSRRNFVRRAVGLAEQPALHRKRLEAQKLDHLFNVKFWHVLFSEL